jgi:hypothetical protein
MRIPISCLVSSASRDLRVLESLMPSANGLRVFDAETQETSYGIWLLDGLPYIFDTHRSQGRYVATIELLTEIVNPVRIGPAQILRFGHAACRRGLLPIPYSGCFFKENLHVYAFSGPVRGFDLSALGRSPADAERNLRREIEALWPQVPEALRRAQRELFTERRRVRYPADLEVLRRHGNPTAARETPRRPVGR